MPKAQYLSEKADDVPGLALQNAKDLYIECEKFLMERLGHRASFDCIIRMSHQVMEMERTHLLAIKMQDVSDSLDLIAHCLRRDYEV